MEPTEQLARVMANEDRWAGWDQAPEKERRKYMKVALRFEKVHGSEATEKVAELVTRTQF